MLPNSSQPWMQHPADRRHSRATNASPLQPRVAADFDWAWAEAVKDQNNFQPALGVDFMMDDYLNATVAAGVGVHMAYQGTAPFVHGSNASQAKWKPLTYEQLHTPGASTDPASYAAYASSAFQVAARYGQTKVPASLLKLAPNQPVRSGLGTLGAFEAGNEWSGTWNGREAYFSPLEYAAFLSAAYDGHEGSMGPGMGVKAADPGMAVSNAGLAELANCSIDYLEGMYLWSAQNREDKSLPADILSIHHYANNVNGPIPGTSPMTGEPDPDIGIMPEADNLTARVAAYAGWRDKRAPSALLWWGEFGYDTSGGPQRSPAIGNMSAEEVQAAWLVRSLFAIAAGGADGAQMFMMADVNSNQPFRFSSSGLVTDKTSFFQPKASWYIYHTLTNTIANLFICNRTDDEVANVAIATLASDCTSSNAAGSTEVWVIWSPTSTDRIVAEYSLDVTGATSSTATIMTLQDKEPLGVNSTVPITAGRLVLHQITEMPTVVFA